MPLTAAQVEELRVALAARAARLVGEIREALHQHPGAATFANRHDEGADDAIADLEEDLAIAGVARDSRELREVEEALARIGRPGFGICVDCAAPIPWVRLLAEPQARRCLRCQQRTEAR